MPGKIFESISPQPASSSYNHEPSSDTAAVVTLAAAGAGKRHAIASVAWSYDDDPTGGSLTITDGGTAVFKVDITSKGPGFFNFFPPLLFSANSAVVATLAAGGSGISGIVNVNTWVM